MPIGWRIERAQRAAPAFSGEGARIYGGRWNSRGFRVAYLGEHQSLSALEVFVNNQPLSAAADHVMLSAEWDAALMETVPVGKLPPDWRGSPPGAKTAAVGDRWLREARSAVLAVPSAIIPAEMNFLLNPAHPDFRRISIGKPQPFEFDPRILHR
jgi:RES domain-containing protein